MAGTAAAQPALAGSAARSLVPQAWQALELSSRASPAPALPRKAVQRKAAAQRMAAMSAAPQPPAGAAVPPALAGPLAGAAARRDAAPQAARPGATMQVQEMVKVAAEAEARASWSRASATLYRTGVAAGSVPPGAS